MRRGGFFLSDLKDRTVAGYDNLGKPSVSDKQVLGREAVVGGFMGSVKVEPVRGSRLVRINVVSPNRPRRRAWPMQWPRTSWP
jgi:hypothetical protein